jgi:hypothetical protein
MVEQKDQNKAAQNEDIDAKDVAQALVTEESEAGNEETESTNE